MFKRILIANRGEIALRVMRACREMGIESVAIYHDVDRTLPYVRFADLAVKLESNIPKAGYLDIEQIINIARKTNSEAIHPGYGFLSERAEFSAAIEAAGLKFIGPKASSISIMGSKTEARKLMSQAGVPVVPGTLDGISNIEELKKSACEIGYPVLLKAAAGGGGKGMVRVDNETELQAAFESAQRQAQQYFGNDTVYIEKFIINPKHIEIQILSDAFGNCIHLGERDCSIQRRHQKVIEEAPSTVLDSELRSRMGKVATDAACACGYVNAGTIEFIFDRDKNFYFLEMNTRLQVEHPVTEFVTGVDLVKEQIRIAAGLPLSYKQEDIKHTGHAIECRINSEDPYDNFMPSTGKISFYEEPGGFGVRVDRGYSLGSDVGIHFDSMLGKLITWAPTRREAISRMDRALQEYRIYGVKTTIPFELAVMRNTEFIDGYFDTGFLENTFDFEVLEKMRSDMIPKIAAIAAWKASESNPSLKIKSDKQQSSNWKMRRKLSDRNGF